MNLFKLLAIKWVIVIGTTKILKKAIDKHFEEDNEGPLA